MQTPLSYGGLALANSIAALVEAAVLIRLISIRLPGLRVETPGHLGRCASWRPAWSWACPLPGSRGAAASPLLRPYGTPGQALLLATCVGAGAALYAVVSLAFRSDELHALWRLVRR